ncbi:hypothetical protein LS77_007160 [Helicobacter bilis]|uniref:Uncharacterized protein n=1 Tax=Helicobacter bilis TaxID=37372 RepID=A0A6D2C4Z3_9HELI|nr:hypothetical protein [Helicobacter bilis]TLE03125.1 hypothetical protein LS76_010615 [Helicobacter bilis]TLE04075.1 hypothetical protein LS77_007160 [Helicobacter bilis]
MQYSNILDSIKDISCLRTRTTKALAHTCKYDTTLDSKPLGCHFECSETSSIESKINTKTIRTHKTSCKAKYV